MSSKNPENTSCPVLPKTTRSSPETLSNESSSIIKIVQSLIGNKTKVTISCHAASHAATERSPQLEASTSGLQFSTDICREKL